MHWRSHRRLQEKSKDIRKKQCNIWYCKMNMMTSVSERWRITEQNDAHSKTLHYFLHTHTPFLSLTLLLSLTLSFPLTLPPFLPFLPPFLFSSLPSPFSPSYPPSLYPSTHLLADRCTREAPGNEVEVEWTEKGCSTRTGGRETSTKGRKSLHLLKMRNREYSGIEWSLWSSSDLLQSKFISKIKSTHTRTHPHTRARMYVPESYAAKTTLSDENTFDRKENKGVCDRMDKKMLRFNAPDKSEELGPWFETENSGD